MPFVPAPNIIQCEVRQTMASQHIESRFMIDNLAAPDSAALIAAATTVWDWWENNIAPLISVQVALNEVLATDMSAEDGAQYTYAPDATTTGDLDGACLPNEVAICVSLRTGNRGRSARGRFFQSGIMVASLDSPNTISSAQAALWQAAGQALIDALDPATPLVIVSYITGGAPRVGGPVYYPVSTAVLTDRVVDSQRRRKPGVGT
jgi:hypothetical protein